MRYCSNYGTKVACKSTAIFICVHFSSRQGERRRQVAVLPKRQRHAERAAAAGADPRLYGIVHLLDEAIEDLLIEVVERRQRGDGRDWLLSGHRHRSVGLVGRRMTIVRSRGVPPLLFQRLNHVL